MCVGGTLASGSYGASLLVRIRPSSSITRKAWASLVSASLKQLSFPSYLNWAKYPECRALIQYLFAARGETFRSRARGLDLEFHINGLLGDLKRNSHQLSTLEEERVRRDSTLRECQNQLQGKNQAIQEREHELQVTNQAIQEREHELQVKDQVIQEREHELQVKDQVIQEREHELQVKDQVIPKLRRDAQLRERAIDEQEQRIADLDQLASSTQTELTEVKRLFQAESLQSAVKAGEVENLRQDLVEVRRQLGLIESSTSWKAISRLRSAFDGHPKARRWLGRLIRVAWWTVTLQLIDRLKARRSLFKARDMIAASDLFDARWYLSRYPDVAANGADPALHYVLFGATERRDPSSPLQPIRNMKQCLD